MDQELVAYLDRMSQQIIEGVRGEMSQQIDGLRGEVSQQIDGLRGEVSQQIDGLRGEVSQKIDGLRGEMDEFREEVRQENRHTRVLMEGMRSDIQLMAEIAMDTRELFKRHESEVERRLEEMKALIPLPYKDLNTRVSLLEERFDRQGRDAMEVLREKFGKRQA